MQGRTQDFWHHRVPKEKTRGPRFNINFRYILPDRDELSLKGIRAFYKYMVSGDSKSSDWDITAEPLAYRDIVRKSGPMHLFTKPLPASSSSASAACTQQEITPSLRRKGLLAEDTPGTEEWVCSACTFLNRAMALRCDICETQRASCSGEEGKLNKDCLSSASKQKRIDSNKKSRGCSGPGKKAKLIQSSLILKPNS